jgi:hypothetical protein
MTTVIGILAESLSVHSESWAAPDQTTTEIAHRAQSSRGILQARGP